MQKLRLAVRSVKRVIQQLRDRHRTAEQVFTQIYEGNKWGGEVGSYCSGTGSRLPSLVDGYINAVTNFLKQRNLLGTRFVEIGCGDFFVGRQLLDYCSSYVGVDVVRPLVEHNKLTFGGERVMFLHCDATAQDLPDGDVCFVRQVFQHLSNSQILAVLPKLQKYRVAVITEHHPSRLNGSPNIDIIHGPGTRFDLGSGVFLLDPPFSLPVEQVQLICSLPLPSDYAISDNDAGVLNTYAYTT